MKTTKPRIQKSQSDTTSIIKKIINLYKDEEWQSSLCCLCGVGKLYIFYNIQKYAQDADRSADLSWKQTVRFLEQYGNKKPVNSEPCLSVAYKNRKKFKDKRLSNLYLHNAAITLNLRQFVEPYAGPDNTTRKAPYLMTDYMPIDLTNLKSNKNGTGTSIMVILPGLECSIYRFNYNCAWNPILQNMISVDQITEEQNENCCINSIDAIAVDHFGENHLEKSLTWNERQNKQYKSKENFQKDSSIRHASTKLKCCVSSKISIKHNVSSNMVHLANDCEMQKWGQFSFNASEVLIRPYARTYFVYNAKEQVNAQMKEQGTSQQFKQRSQGIGSGSVSGDGSSSTPPKRRAIRIESGCTFSVEFIDRGKSSGSETSSPEPVTDTKTKGKGKKDLHRCLCTLSFPTDDKKLKNKPCDSGVCVPGKCTPSECFRRLQEKYGSKKSVSDISSSQASQTSKKKERQGRETLVKEKGSSSISKYKESVEMKPVPEKEPEKFNIVSVVKNCCNKLQFWKKDKQIELKPAVIGTNISVKDDKEKSFGSNAATQSGKAKDGKKIKEKKGKKGTETKEEKKKENKKEKKKEKKEEKKEAKKEKKKKGGKKKTKEEMKTETRATGVKTKKGRTLLPYECEPGICTPKVCSPKECYDRKFPPAPAKPVGSPPLNFMIYLKKLCCNQTVTETGGVSAATQARKSTTPGMPPGTTVYKEAGSSVKQRGDTGIQQPLEGGDVSVDTRIKKPTAYSGIQYYQTFDNDTMMQRQGVNIGSECGCSLEFYKNMY